MKDGIKKIIAEGIGHDACGMIQGIDSWEKAIATLLSPQGREFAMRTGFPSLSTFRNNVEEVSTVPGVFIDSGRSLASNMDCVAVGDTDLTVFLRNPDKLFHVMVMHGAHLIIDARNHAVVTATVIDGTIYITGDGTASITIERKHE